MNNRVGYCVSGALRTQGDKRKNIDVPFYFGARNALEVRARYRGSCYNHLVKKNPSVIRPITPEEIPDLERKITDEGLILNLAMITGYIPKEYRWYLND